MSESFENALAFEMIEQLRVQLAGCSVAALGEVANPAKMGDYGWSPAYEDVLNLRIAFDKKCKLITELLLQNGLIPEKTNE